MPTGTGLSAPGSPKPSSTVSTIAWRSTTSFIASRTFGLSKGGVSTQTETVIEFDAAVSSSLTDGSSFSVEMTDGSTFSIRSTWPALIAETAATASCATVMRRQSAFGWPAFQ